MSTVDQGALDDEVDVPQPVAQDGDADRDRKQEQQKGIDESNQNIWGIRLIDLREQAVEEEAKDNKPGDAADQRQQAGYCREVISVEEQPLNKEVDDRKHTSDEQGDTAQAVRGSG
jgi:hypothetical protein